MFFGVFSGSLGVFFGRDGFFSRVALVLKHAFPSASPATLKLQPTLQHRTPTVWGMRRPLGVATHPNDCLRSESSNNDFMCLI